MVSGYSQPSQTLLYQLYSLHILKTFFKCLVKSCLLQNEKCEGPAVAAWDVFHHICLFPHRTELQLLVVEELIQLTLTWLRAGADPKSYPQSAAAPKYKKVMQNHQTSTTSQGSIVPLFLSVQLYWKHSQLYEKISPNPSGGCKVAELYLKTWATDSCHWHRPLGPLLIVNTVSWSQC